jgi:tRNA threonylcarbamoyladenosine biosynthesis protein TsaB
VITLAIDASTYVGDVAVLDDTRVLAEESTAMKDAERERLMPAVASVLERAGVKIGAVGRIVCGAGPGSFTSLRIAGGIAKGLAAGAGIPLFAVPSMALIVAGANLGMGRYLAAVDALRGEFYVGLYHVSASGDVLELERSRLVPADAVQPMGREYDARVVGPSPVEGGIVASPKAAGIAKLMAWLDASPPADLATWEPSYGRLAEAQVKWEAAHGRPLPAG